MTIAVTRKPFYTRPPWNILFDIERLQKLAPWNVNIAYLLRSFLLEMEKQGKVDFRASGVALDSSALIYLMKSKLLLTLQELPTQSTRGPTDVVPPPLFLPLRHELTSTTIQHLLAVLDEVLRGEKPLNIDRVVLQPVLPQAIDLMPQFDKFIAEIEMQMDKLYARMVEMVQGQGIIEFNTLIKGMARLDAVRTFILLLFLANDGLIGLWQNEETEEIYIAIGKLKVAEYEQRRSKPD
jgi:chromatin segregation and condensation protein Rec8/ScpA/Scc1 (kleisin family)